MFYRITKTAHHDLDLHRPRADITPPSTIKRDHVPKNGVQHKRVVGGVLEFVQSSGCRVEVLIIPQCHQSSATLTPTRAPLRSTQELHQKFANCELIAFCCVVNCVLA